MIKEAFTRSSSISSKSAVDLLTAIRSECPRLLGQAVSYPAGGINGHTIIFPDEVFKGLKRPDDARFFDMECRVLQHVAGKVKLTPQITHIGKDAVFFGMERLQGVTPSQKFFDSMTEEQSIGLAKDIATFVHEFASAFSKKDVQDVLGGEIMPNVTASKIAECLENPLVKDYLDTDFSRVSEVVQEYVSKVDAQEGNAIVYHPDLNLGNFLVDPETKRASGFFDFGTVSYGPVENAFATLDRCVPQEFLKKICQQYNAISGKKIEYRGIVLCNLAQSLGYLQFCADNGETESAERFKGAILNCLTDLTPAKQQVTNRTVCRP